MLPILGENRRCLHLEFLREDREKRGRCALLRDFLHIDLSSLVLSRLVLLLNGEIIVSLEIFFSPRVVLLVGDTNIFFLGLEMVVAFLEVYLLLNVRYIQNQDGVKSEYQVPHPESGLI